MSQYSELRAGPFAVESTKNDIDAALMALFVRSDKQTRPIEVREWLEMDGVEESWKPSYAHVHYFCPINAMKDRLDLLGFTLGAAAEAFALGVTRELSRTEGKVAGHESSVQNDPPEVLRSVPGAVDEAREHCVCMLEFYRKRLQALKELNLDFWLKDLRKVRELELVSSRPRAPENSESIIEYILELGGIRWGCPCVEPRFLLRLLLEACDPDDDVDYDLTSLILGDQFESSEDMVGYAEYLLSREHEIYRRVIVLTEGPSDKWILERSLRLLYPHLSEFFSFMDLKGARIDGGSGALANLVRAFAGAGISNRIVAIFDNDTAGRSALQSLAQIKLPENIVIMKLPQLPIAEMYPTQGPTGISLMDVNGLACSIELYLGMDVLKAEGGDYRPIEWRGLDMKLRQYQGEILEKNTIQDLFHAKLARCEKGESKIADSDWTGMELILTSLRGAFQALDASQHVEAEESYQSSD